MFKQLFGLACATVLAMTGTAQINIMVNEGNASFENGSHPALVVTVYETDIKDVEKETKGLLKDWGAKVQSKKEFFGDDAKLKSMGDNTFDVYATVREMKEGEIEVSFAIDLGGAYMTSSQHSSQFNIIKAEIHKWAVNTTKIGIQGQVKAQEKILSDFEKDLKDLEKEQENLEKSIEENKKRIQEAEKAIEQAKIDIEDSKKAQEDKRVTIGNQMKVVDDTKAKEKAVK